eukprot:8136658-Pyramimonas_sp.AAC.1
MSSMAIQRVKWGQHHTLQAKHSKRAAWQYTLGSPYRRRVARIPRKTESSIHSDGEHHQDRGKVVLHG